MTSKRRFGFKGKNQIPLFMIWDEEWDNGQVVFARVIFNSARFSPFRFLADAILKARSEKEE